MKTLRFLTFMAVLWGTLALPVPAQAQSPELLPDLEDRVIFGGEFTLRSGEALNGDLISFGGRIVLEQDSVVDGDLVTMGGSVQSEGTIGGDFVAMGTWVRLSEYALVGGNFVPMGGTVEADGTISGDFVAMGSQANLGEHALVRGSLAMLGSSLHRAPGSEVMGDVITDSFPVDIELPELPTISQAPLDFRMDGFSFPRQFRGAQSFGGGLADDVLWTLFRAFAMATVAVLMVLFLPRHARRAADAVVAEPIAASGLALVTLIALPFVAILLSLTLILIPVVLLLVLLCAIALIFGWVAIGLEVGERLEAAFKSEWTEPVKAGVGAFVLSFAVALIGLIPCLGWLAGFLMLLLAFGGVLLTRFGTQAYPMIEVLPVEAPAKKAASKMKSKADKG